MAYKVNGRAGNVLLTNVIMIIKIVSILSTYISNINNNILIPVRPMLFYKRFWLHCFFTSRALYTVQLRSDNCFIMKIFD